MTPAADGITIGITDPRDNHAKHCLRAYFAELARRFHTGFNPEISNSATEDELTLPQGLLLVAHQNGAPVGCGALKFHSESVVAEVKRMWVSPDCRGDGLGRRLLDRLEAEAQGRGIRTLRLETNEVLTEAINMYGRAGFHEVDRFNDEPYASSWFEKSIVSDPTYFRSAV